MRLKHKKYLNNGLDLNNKTYKHLGNDFIDIKDYYRNLTNLLKLRILLQIDETFKKWYEDI